MLIVKKLMEEVMESCVSVRWNEVVWKDYVERFDE